MISPFDLKVVSFCTCLLKIWQFLSSATGFLVFLTFFGKENLKIRAQILHLSIREEISVIFCNFYKNQMRNKVTNLFFNELVV